MSACMPGVSVARVMRTIGRLRGLIERHPLMADLLLAVALLAAALAAAGVWADALSDPAHPAPGSTENAFALAAVILPLVLRRRFPLAVVLCCTTTYIAYALLLGPAIEGTITVIALSLAVYSAAAHGPARLRNRVCTVCLVAIVVLVVVNNPYDFSCSCSCSPRSSTSRCSVGCGRWAPRSARVAAAPGSCFERTVELEREREENARRAVFEERVRIARELHDVVAHHVSVMGVQAGAARLVIDRDPLKAKAALAPSRRPAARRCGSCTACSDSCARQATPTTWRRSRASASCAAGGEHERLRARRRGLASKARSARCRR